MPTFAYLLSLHKITPQPAGNYRFVLLLLLFPFQLFAIIPAGYYTFAEGKKEASLKTALHQLIRSHEQLEYYSSSTHFRTTDWHPEGYFWDMYSLEKRNSWSNLNREHSMPKSWWSPQPEYTVAYSDLHNLYPSNVDANSAKSNFPLGVVGSSFIFDNGVSRVGQNTFPGYSGTVFEPAGEYKGDFARTYMYMVTCYEDYAMDWRSTGTQSMLYQNTYPVFRPYAVNLLLKWHREDPVSEKEKNRNNAVYEIQQNRNPFIDYPQLAEFIWGNQKGQAWTPEATGTETEEIFSVGFSRTRQELMIRLQPSSTVAYNIHSIDGRRVLTGNLSGELSVIPTGGILVKGVYLVIVETSVKTHSRLFIIE